MSCDMIYRDITCCVARSAGLRLIWRCMIHINIYQYAHEEWYKCRMLKMGRKKKKEQDKKNKKCPVWFHFPGYPSCFVLCILCFRSILFYSMLVYAIPVYSILFYSIPSYSIILFSILVCTILLYAIPPHSILFHSILLSSVPFMSNMVINVGFFRLGRSVFACVVT